MSLAVATNDEDRAKANKNIGVCATKLTALYSPDDNHESLVDKRLFEYKTGLQAFEDAMAAGRRGQLPASWIGDVTSIAIGLYQHAAEWPHQETVLGKRHRLMHRLNLTLEIPCYPQVHAEAWLNLVRSLFGKACSHQAEGEHMIAIDLLAEMARPLGEADRIYLAIGHKEGIEETAVLRDEMQQMRCTAEAAQATAAGVELLDRALSEETLSMDAVWDVIDWLRRAIILTRELDIEQEAAALSHMGRVFLLVIKHETRAAELLTRCIQLALSAHPRSFATSAWYNQATTLMEQIQRRRLQRETDEAQRLREPILLKLKIWAGCVFERCYMSVQCLWSRTSICLFMYRYHFPFVRTLVFICNLFTVGSDSLCWNDLLNCAGHTG
jgi:tetratricopeptide (TPR) repeat protein